MTDEEKRTECKCGELGRFFTLVAAIFLGVLLAILVSAALLKPKCPCRGPVPFPPRPMYERQIPPMHGQWGVKTPDGQFNIQGKKFNKEGMRKHSQNFQPPMPEKTDTQR